MKIAITATGSTLDAEVDPRFGRCQYFIIADTETLKFEVVENSSAAASGGAGISAAQMIASKGVKAVLTGNSGPNAYQVLSSAGIEVVTGVSGKIKDAIEGYKSGKFQSSSQPNVPGHFGTGASFGSGGGMGMGRGMGRGMGMGMGRGMGMGGGMAAWGMPPVTPVSQPQSLQEELEALKAQSQMLAKQLEEIQSRIKELEK
jgi:predicted Fe-Mo cluster-binding NifX family protein